MHSEEIFAFISKLRATHKTYGAKVYADLNFFNVFEIAKSKKKLVINSCYTVSYTAQNRPMDVVMVAFLS